MALNLPTGYARPVLLTLLMLQLGWMPGAAAEESTAIIANGELATCMDPSFPPLEFYENPGDPRPVGLDVDVADALANAMGVKSTIIPTEFAGLLPSLEAGRCDVVISGIMLTPQRLEALSGIGYLDTKIVLLVRGGNPSDINAPEDLSGNVVAVEAGTHYLNVLEELNEQLVSDGLAPATIQTYPKQTDAIQQVILGRAVAAVSQDTEVAHRNIENPGEFEAGYVFPETNTFGIYFKPDEASQALLQETLKSVAGRGELAAIAEKWNLPPDNVTHGD